MSKDPLTWQQVRRRQLVWFGVSIGGIVLLIGGMPIVLRLFDGRALAVVGGVLMVTSFTILGGALVAQLRAMTESGRHALRTGEVLPGAASAELEQELSTRRSTQTTALFFAAMIVVGLPAGAVIAHIEGSANQPLLSWATALLVGGPVAALAWAAWVWPRRRRVGAALRTLRS